MAEDNYYAVPSVAARYDSDTRTRSDLPFYLALVRQLNPSTVVDLGAGTGRFCSLLASAGVTRVIGVEPQRTMIDLARQQPDADQVEWIHGTAADLPSSCADLVFMTGHVAQYFLDDSSWCTVLRQVRHALAPGGLVAFEVRNASAEAWREWNDAAPRAVPGGSVSQSTTLTGDLVTHVDEWHIDGRTYLTSETLRFPDDATIQRGLNASGLQMVRTWGDWDRSPATESSPERIVIAQPVAQ